jgi:hypothetical protein
MTWNAYLCDGLRRVSIAFCGWSCGAVSYRVEKVLTTQHPVRLPEGTCFLSVNVGLNLAQPNCANGDSEVSIFCGFWFFSVCVRVCIP